MNLKKVKWYDRQRVDVGDMNLEQTYYIERIKNSLIRTASDGVFSGLQVSDDSQVMFQSTSNQTTLHLNTSQNSMFQIFRATADNLSRIILKGRQTGIAGSLLIRFYKLATPTDPLSAIGDFINEKAVSASMFTTSSIPSEVSVDLVELSNVASPGSFEIGNYYIIKLIRDSVTGVLELQYSDANPYSNGYVRTYTYIGDIYENKLTWDFYMKLYSNSVQMTAGSGYKNGNPIEVAIAQSKINLVNNYGVDNYICVKYKEADTDIELNPRWGNDEYSRTQDSFEVVVTTTLPPITDDLMVLAKTKYSGSFPLSVTDLRYFIPKNTLIDFKEIDNELAGIGSSSSAPDTDDGFPYTRAFHYIPKKADGSLGDVVYNTDFNIYTQEGLDIVNNVGKTITYTGPTAPNVVWIKRATGGIEFYPGELSESEKLYLHYYADTEKTESQMEFENVIIYKNLIVRGNISRSQEVDIQSGDAQMNLLHGQGIFKNYLDEFNSVLFPGELKIGVKAGKSEVAGGLAVKSVQTNFTFVPSKEAVAVEYVNFTAGNTQILTCNGSPHRILKTATVKAGAVGYTISYDSPEILDFNIKTDGTAVITRVSMAVPTIVQVAYEFALPRYDLIQISKDNALTVKEGTPANIPVAPIADTDNIPLWLVDIGEYIGETGEEFEVGDLTDDRLFLKEASYGDGAQWGRDAISNEAVGTNQIEKTTNANKIQRINVANEAIGTNQLEKINDADKIQTINLGGNIITRINVVNEAVGRLQIERTNDEDKIDNNNIKDFSVGVEKYHHLLTHKGMWFDMEWQDNTQAGQMGTPTVSYWTALIYDPDIYPGIPNGAIVALSNNGKIYRFDYKTGVQIDYYDFTAIIPACYDMIKVEYDDGSTTKHYVVSIHKSTAPYNCLAVIDINSTTGVLTVKSILIVSPSDTYKNAYGIVEHNGFIYQAYYGTLDSNGVYVNKISVSNVMTGVSTWVYPVLQVASGRLGYITVDPTKTPVVFYVGNRIGNYLHTFSDTGTSVPYQSSPNLVDGTNALSPVVYHDGLIYTCGTAGPLKGFTALSSYNVPWNTTIRRKIYINPGWANQAQTYSNFKVGLDGRFYGAPNISGRFWCVLDPFHIPKIIPRMADSDSYYTGIIIGEKAHIINDEWKIRMEKTGIDLTNKIAGRVDGLSEMIPSSWYFVWVFADNNNVFQGIGVTKQPKIWLTTFNNSLNKRRGEIFTIGAPNTPKYTPNGDFDFESTLYHFNFFTVGATIKINSIANGSSFRIAKIVEITDSSMTCETIVASYSSSINESTIVQVNNFKPYVYGSGQLFVHPKFKLISKAVRVTSLQRVMAFSNNKGYVYDADQENLTTLIYGKFNDSSNSYPPGVMVNVHCNGWIGIYPAIAPKMSRLVSYSHGAPEGYCSSNGLVSECNQYIWDKYNHVHISGSNSVGIVGFFDESY